VRFIWGKSWNVPGVVISVAERLEQFDGDGTPQRSWLSLRLRRVEEPASRPAPPLPVTPQFETPSPAEQTDEDTFPVLDVPVDNDGTPLDRLDQIAAEHYGNPELARALGDFNGLDDLLKIAEGTTVALPALSTLWRTA
jgi:nucleoid-associated protein YgaU